MNDLVLTIVFMWICSFILALLLQGFLKLEEYIVRSRFAKIARAIGKFFEAIVVLCVIIVGLPMFLYMAWKDKKERR